MSTNGSHVWARHSGHHINQHGPALLARVTEDTITKASRTGPTAHHPA
ncbi:hypothetical protein LWP59_27230 [Amycolatopsis acidiphila]|nr:hypothetical protein [Amycolatopsis acidiphila]UIJ57818.1 hypothetical protein LWP59_27230 [Amycolatopsis acidiphila]